MKRPWQDWREGVCDAIKSSDMERLRELLPERPAGVSLDAPLDPAGTSPLMMASWGAQMAACELLLAAGADPEARDRHGKPCLLFGADEVGGADEEALARARDLFTAYLGGAYPRDLPAEYHLRAEYDDVSEAGRRANMNDLTAAVDVEFKRCSLPAVRWDLPIELPAEVWLTEAERRAALGALNLAARSCQPDPPSTTVSLVPAHMAD